MLTGFLVCVFPIFLFAEVSTDKGRVNADWNCDAYKQLLSGDPSSADPDCHRLANFLIDWQHESDEGLIRQMADLADANSSLGSFTRVMWNLLKSRETELAKSAQLAQRRMTILMARSNDLERAELYAELFYRVSKNSRIGSCTGLGNCKPSVFLIKIEELLGDEFAFVENTDPSVLLMCLLRTDAFIVPIRVVLESPGFIGCTDAF